MRSRVALLVIARAPSCGRNKTRLLGTLNCTNLSDLPRSFLLDTLETMERADGAEPGILYMPAGTEQEFESLAPFRPLLLQQRGVDLGQRLYFAFVELFGLGFTAGAIVNADSPTLPPEFLRRAIELLTRSGDRLVLGPASDGGYYLVGLKRAHRALFEGISWSTSLVLQQTLDVARRLSLNVELLPEWYDVDTAVDLRRAIAEVSADGDVDLARHTRNWWQHAIHLGGEDVAEITPTASAEERGSPERS